MKKYKLLVALILLIALIGKSVISLGVTKADVDAEKKKADQLKTEAEQKKKELTNIKSDKAVATTDLNTINGQIESLQSDINALSEKLDELNSEIKTKEKEIKVKEKEYKEKEEILKKRLVALYKKGSTSYLDVLFSSANYVDMLSSYDVVEKIAESDNKLMEEIQKVKESLENNKNSQLKVTKNKKQTEVNKLSDKEKATQIEIDNKQKAIQQAEQSMASIFKKLQAQIAAQRAAEEARRKSASSRSGGSSSRGSSSGVAGLNFDGTFQWPTATKIVTSRMKYRWGRMHKGIDIGVSYQPIYAAASGIAYNAYNPGGYGTYVMLFHGNGYVTLYGHLSTSKVADGQTVSKGQVIAISGNSGGSTGPHLHFEIRKAESASDFFSKSPLDPLQYLPGGYTLNE